MRLSPWALSLALVAGALAAPRAQAASIQYLSPFGSSFGIAYGVDGKNVVGEDAAHRAFLYDGSTYKLIPSPSGGHWTPRGISGGRIVGTWGSVGLLYENGNFTTISHPLAAYGTLAYGIDGDRIVGSFADGSKVSRGFLFDGNSYTTIN